MKKKIISVFCSAIILVSIFAACQKTSGGSQSQQGTDVTKITLWHSLSEYAGGEIESYVIDFNNTTGKELGIEIESVYQGQYTDATTKLRTILQNNQRSELPDIMQIDSTGVIDYKNSEYAYTLEQALKNHSDFDMKSLVQTTVDYWTRDGVKLGMPFNASTTVMLYNKTMLGNAGVAQAPTTFDEIIEVSKKLPSTTPDGLEITAFAYIPDTPSLANWIGQIPGNGVNSSYVLDNRNGRTQNASKLVCDAEGTLEHFLTEWKKMYDEGALKNQSESIREMFESGQLAFMITSTSAIRSVLNNVGDRFEIGCAYYPRIDQNSNFGATISGSAMFMFDKGNQESLDASWEFLKYLTSPEIQARFGAATGYLPVNTEAYANKVYVNTLKDAPQMETGAKQIEISSSDMAGITVGPARDFYYEIQNQISHMLTSGASPAETVEKMAETLNNILSEYNLANED